MSKPPDINEVLHAEGAAGVRARRYRPGGNGGGANDQKANSAIEDFVAFMPNHQYIFKPTREMWPASSVNARVPRIPLVDAAGQPELDPNGKPKMIHASAWLDQHRAVEQMTWAPGEPMEILGRLISDGGWIERPGCTTFNLYRPPTIIPTPGDVTPWLRHARKVYPGEADHIIRWLAHRVQRPHEKINHALVLGGAQGVGKDTLLEPAKHAVAPWNFAEVSPRQLLGRFNGFVKSVILRVNEARDLGDVDRFSFYDHLKAYTAAPPDVLRCDEKHRREHAVLNVCGVIITSNHKTDGIFLPADDRRHYVAWTDLTKDDFPDGYWNNLYGWYEAGGHAHVAAYLGTLDLSRFDPKAPPPKTQAFWEIVGANRAPENAELADAIERLGNPNALTITDVANACTDAGFEAWLRDRKNARRISHRLEESGYVAVRNADAKDGLWRVRAKRQAVYAKATLPLRDRIVAARKHAEQ